MVITELRSATYFAELHLKRGDEELTVSSRPSDAVALAVRTAARCTWPTTSWTPRGSSPPSDEDEDGESANPDELVGEFRQFLDPVRPEDFSS